jgi:hypothetical protein
MQVVGSSLVLPAVQMVARRAGRDAVRRDWAERVIFRHIKRTPSLMARVATREMLEQVLSKEKLPAEAQERIRSAFEAGDEFFAPSGPLVTAFIRHASDTMDFVCSLPDDDRRIRRIDRMSWSDAEALSEAWHATIARNGQKSRDLIVGTRRIKEFDGGVHIAELLTPEALSAEGNAMGHCVGGYWKRVFSGATRIVSLRDQHGHPHVTIELGGSPRIRLDDGRVLSVDHDPKVGRDVVSEMTGEWMAVQVRGKQNKLPVEKWQRYVDEYFAKTGMAWNEFGIRVGGSDTGRKLVTFRVGHVIGEDPDRVAAASEAAFAISLQGDASEFGAKYRRSGLEEVHRHCGDGKRLAKQAEIYLPLAMSSVGLQVDRGVPFQRAVGQSSVSSVLRLLSGDDKSASAARRSILDLAIENDIQSSAVTEAPLVSMPGQKPLSIYRHELPLMTVALLSMGALQGMEDDIAELVKPSLSAAISHMRSHPGAIHTIAAGIGGCEQGDILSAILLCRLSADHALAVSKVEAGVRAKVKEMRLAAKRDRIKAGSNLPVLNLVSNLLADGFEGRLKDLARKGGKGGLLISPSPAAPVVARRIEPEPVIKRYKMPGR